MNWQQVAAKLALNGLPLLGRVLGGQIPIIGQIPTSGGSTAGGKLGEGIGQTIAEAIALALGVPVTPAAVSAAIEQQPTTEVMAKLKAIEAEAATRWPALAEIEKSRDTAEIEVARINAETYRALAAKVVENNFWMTIYRPVLIAIAASGLIAVILLVLYAFAFGGPIFDRLNAGNLLLQTLLAVLFALIGWHWKVRRDERVAGMTGEAMPGPVAGAAATVAKAATGKK